MDNILERFKYNMAHRIDGFKQYIEYSFDVSGYGYKDKDIKLQRAYEYIELIRIMLNNLNSSDEDMFRDLYNTYFRYEFYSFISYEKQYLPMPEAFLIQFIKGMKSFSKKYGKEIRLIKINHFLD